MTTLQLYNKINSILKKFFKLNVIKATSINFYNENYIPQFISVWIYYKIKDEEKTKTKDFNFGVDDNNLYNKIEQLNNFYNELQNKSANS